MFTDEGFSRAGERARAAMPNYTLAGQPSGIPKRYQVSKPSNKHFSFK
jgi:hypothetical protein